MRPLQGDLFDLVIGGFINRLQAVPTAFSSENLDIRRRPPDHRIEATPFRRCQSL